jgi:hypothetical protein
MADPYNPYVPRVNTGAGGIGGQNTGPQLGTGTGVDGSTYQNKWNGLGGTDSGGKQSYDRELWGRDTNAAKSWLTNSQAAAETRGNYYYGGSAGGADAFNNNLAGVSQNQSQNFATDSDNAVGLSQNAGYYGQQAAANQRAAMGRNPGQFLDLNGMVDNAHDRGAQMNAIGSLNNSIGGLNQYIANGPGPSAAQAQLNMATDANMGNALALARSGRGLGQSQSALRQAIGQNAVTQQQAANQSAVLRAQEGQNWQQNQLSAYGQLGNLAGAAGGIATNARAGDLGQSSYLTGSQQAAQNANDQAGLGYAGIQQGYGQQQLTAGQQSLAANTALAQSQNSLLGLQNNVNQQQLTANQNYESLSQGNWLGSRQSTQQTGGTDYTPYIQAGATALAML